MDPERSEATPAVIPTARREMDPERSEATNQPGKVKTDQDTTPPVILRWQDLPDVPENKMIIIAPEDFDDYDNFKPPPPGKGKETSQGPQLANYIYMGEVLLACKMCPNPDWHRTFQCPNVTPELKEFLKEERSKFPISQASRAYHPDDMFCYICEKKEHWSSECPYLFVYPAGAHLGPYAELLCLCCGETEPHPGKAGVDWDARCRLKPALSYPTPPNHRLVQRELHRRHS